MKKLGLILFTVFLNLSIACTVDDMPEEFKDIQTTIEDEGDIPPPPPPPPVQNSIEDEGDIPPPPPSEGDKGDD